MRPAGPELSGEAGGHRRRGLLGSVSGGAGGFVQAVANRVAPGVVGALDVDEIVQRTDVQAVVDRIDVQELLDRVDLNRLLDRVDMDALLERVDIDRLLDRLDVARLVDRVDVNAVVGRVDIEGLVERTELSGIIARSTVGVTGLALDLVRSHGAGLDDAVHHWVDRLLRRGRTPQAGAPPLLATDTERAMTSRVQPDRDVRRQDHYAGAVTRLVGYVVDLLVLVALFTLAIQAIEYLGPRVIGVEISLADDPAVGSLGLTAWALLYLAYPLVAFGRSLGMAVLGLRVVRADGAQLGAWRAVVRVLVFPLSILTFGLGFALILLRRDRRALHDLIAGTAVVYGWDASAARLRLLARHPAARWS